MKYADLDTTNQPVAFYDSDIHGMRLIPDPAFNPTKKSNVAPMIANPDTQIPATAVEIPDVKWQRHIDGVKQVYDPVTNAWADYVPTKAEALASARITALAKISADYRSALDAGVTYSGAIFQSDSKSISTLSEALTVISNGWALPANFAWIDTANKPHAANAAYLKGLAVAFADHTSALFARLQTAKTAIMAATTQTAINKVVL